MHRYRGAAVVLLLGGQYRSGDLREPSLVAGQYQSGDLHLLLPASTPTPSLSVRAWDRAAATASRAARGARAEDCRVQGLICLSICFTYMHVFDVFLNFVEFITGI